MSESRIDGIRPEVVAIFEATLGVMLGLIVAIATILHGALYGATVTDSTLQSLVFGLGTSVLSLILVPLIYAILGAAFGYLHGLLFGAVVRAMGGVEVLLPAHDAVPASAMTPSQAPKTRTASRLEPTFGERIPQRPRRKKQL